MSEIDPNLLRDIIMDHYQYPRNHELTKGRRISFSSYGQVILVSMILPYKQNLMAIALKMCVLMGKPARFLQPVQAL